METRLQADLDLLKRQLLDMAARVEQNIGDAVDALRKGDSKTLKQIIKRDVDIDLTELQIDEKCISLLALQQPVAGDLRFIATALKIVKDLERVGDFAKNIARSGLGMLGEKPVQFPSDLVPMVAAARNLLKRALDSFVTQDPALARTVIKDDDIIDNFHKQNLRQFIEVMVGDPSTIGTMTHYLSVDKFIERVGDHSTNIAAMVVYLVEGRDIRHLKKQKARARIKEPGGDQVGPRGDPSDW